MATSRELNMVPVDFPSWPSPPLFYGGPKWSNHIRYPILDQSKSLFRKNVWKSSGDMMKMDENGNTFPIHFFNCSAQLLNRSWWSPFNNWPPGINGPTADKIWIWLLRKHAIYPRPEWWCWVQRRPRRGSPGPTWRSEVEATRMRIALAWKHTPIRPQIRHGRRHQLLGSGTAVSQSMWVHVSPCESKRNGSLLWKPTAVFRFWISSAERPAFADTRCAGSPTKHQRDEGLVGTSVLTKQKFCGEFGGICIGISIHDSNPQKDGIW